MTSSAQPLVTASRGPRAPLARAGIRQHPTPQSHESLELSLSHFLAITTYKLTFYLELPKSRRPRVSDTIGHYDEVITLMTSVSVSL